FTLLDAIRRALAFAKEHGAPRAPRGAARRAHPRAVRAGQDRGGAGGGPFPGGTGRICAIFVRNRILRERTGGPRLDTAAWHWVTPWIRRSLVKKFFAVCFLGLMSAGVAACAVSTEPTDEEVQIEAPGLVPQTVGPCPFEWTCNHTTYYTT